MDQFYDLTPVHRFPTHTPPPHESRFGRKIRARKIGIKNLPALNFPALKPALPLWFRGSKRELLFLEFSRPLFHVEQWDFQTFFPFTPIAPARIYKSPQHPECPGVSS